MSAPAAKRYASAGCMIRISPPQRCHYCQRWLQAEEMPRYAAMAFSAMLFSALKAIFDYCASYFHADIDDGHYYYGYGHYCRHFAGWLLAGQIFEVSLAFTPADIADSYYSFSAFAIASQPALISPLLSFACGHYASYYAIFIITPALSQRHEELHYATPATLRLLAAMPAIRQLLMLRCIAATAAILR
jgi:hypothetical protein